MTKQKHELRFLTWIEADEVFKTDPVIVIPLGSMEVHGSHSIVGDFIAANDVALKAVEQTGAYCTPVVPFGCSEYFRDFPGTISVSPKTLFHWVSDMCTSLTDHGVTKILFLNGHSGNSPTLDYLARTIRRNQGLMTARLDMWRIIPNALKKEVFGEEYQTAGHGGGTVDTVMQYLYPEQMRMDLIQDETRVKQWEGFELKGLGKAQFNNSEVFLPTNMSDMSARGSIGDPSLGNAEGGKKIFETLVGHCVDLVKVMQASNMKLADYAPNAEK